MQRSAADKLFASYAQRVCDPIDVVEPGCDERDLQNPLIVESNSTQAVVVILPDFGGVLRKFDHVVQHDALLRGYGGGRVILL
jgi:hypothetical protein